MAKKTTVGSDGKFAFAHYGGADNPYEAIKVIVAWGYDKDFYIGTALRYIARQGKKAGNPPIQDLEKARWYLDRKIQQLVAIEQKPRRQYRRKRQYRKRSRTEISVEKSLKALGVVPKKTRVRTNK